MTTSRHLSVISGPREPPARLAQLRLAEAYLAADEQVGLLENALAVVNILARDVAEGGPIYPVGVRDLARKLVGDAAWCSQTISAIMVGTGARKPQMDTTGVEPATVAEVADTAFEVA